MNPLPRRSFLTLLLASLARSAVKAARPASSRPRRQLVTCGRERVHILDLDTREPDGAPGKVWTWAAAGRADLPAEYRGLFRATDECKPLDGGRRILITASTGAVALVDRERDRVLFHGPAVNAHSADRLPNDRIAVAASRDPKGSRGDALILFDLASPGRELWRGELPSGHGVVWDEQRRVVWALSDRDIHRFTLADWDTASPRLTLAEKFPLPEAGGHDLAPVPRSPMLAVTTATRCWVFNRDTQAISPHPALGERASVKCITEHPITGQIAYVQADRPNWWSLQIQLLNPAGSVSLAGEQFYKVRWVVDAER